MRDLWMRSSAPHAPYTNLVLRAYVDELAVYVDHRKVYAFRDARARGQMSLHVVPLRDGARLYLRIPRAENRTLLGGPPFLATEATLPLALDAAVVGPLRDSATDLVVGAILFIVGIISIAFSLVRRRGDARSLAYFGVFTALYGARLIFDSYLPLLLGLSVCHVDYAKAFITYVITIPGWALSVRLIGDGWKSTLRRQVWLFALFAPIGVITDLVTRTPASLEEINNVLVILGGINLLFNLLRSEHRRNRELRIVLVGSVVFMLFAVNNNLASLGLLPWSYRGETLGFLVFVGVLGYAATRSFTRRERERVALDSELSAAREIQRSILPAAMPRVAGLRIHAAYDPATSVAGDLYDFLSVDEHRVGVLVADVAGHGVPAALIASMVKMAASMSRTPEDAASVMAGLNETLRTGVRHAFVTATYLWFDLTSERRTVTVCNAGHAPPLLYRDGTFVELGPPGVLLGRFADARYVAAGTCLASGDRIVAFTDGVVEARNRRDEQFGELRLQDVVRASGGRDAQRTAEDVLAAVHRWRGDASEDADDLTIVVMDVE